MAQEFIPTQVGPVKDLQDDLRPISILWYCPTIINILFLSFFCFNSSTYSSHCSNHSGFSLFSLTDVWNFSLPSPIVTKASFVPIQNFVKDRLIIVSFQFNFEEKSILFTNIYFYWEIINQYSFTIFAFYIESLGSPHWKINAFIIFFLPVFIQSSYLEPGREWETTLLATVTLCQLCHIQPWNVRRKFYIFVQ